MSIKQDVYKCNENIHSVEIILLEYKLKSEQKSQANNKKVNELTSKSLSIRLYKERHFVIIGFKKIENRSKCKPHCCLRPFNQRLLVDHRQSQR